ncbi:MAG: zf-HC2 domain-containing protein [Verrucomicrobia bacterium]|nr:zf-HC2 domain-containing protein [Verrucomicrobiota bacterium]
MLTCKEVSKLVSESLEHPLPFRQRMGVRLHLMMCSMCRAYQKQTLLLRAAMRTYARHEPSEPLSEQARQRIKNALKTDGK